MASNRKERDGRAAKERKRERPSDCPGQSHSREDIPPVACLVLCGPSRRSCSTLPTNFNRAKNEETSQPEPKRRRLWGLRGLMKMFQRRVKRKGVGPAESPPEPEPSLRVRSASEVAVDSTLRCSCGPYNQGLSVSHDSVFSSDIPVQTTSQTSPLPAQPTFTMPTRVVNMSELKSVLRRRRADDSGSFDDDSGLPRSPPTSPTSLDVLNHGLKSQPRGTQSTCSDGSLLSMGSSENDEDSSFGALSHHSSKGSLIGYQVVDKEPAARTVPLSHKAALHKISVRPKKSQGIPQGRRKPQILSSSLPSTPEVNEDTTVKSGMLRVGSSIPPMHRYTVALETRLPSSLDEKWKEGELEKRPFYRSVSDMVCDSRSATRESHVSPHRRSLEGGEPPVSPHRTSLEGGEPSVSPHRRILEGGEPSVSPHRRSLDGGFSEVEVQRSSRRKRRDAAGSRLKSDPLLLTDRSGERVIYTPVKEEMLKSGSHRSSSVEGRLEGHVLKIPHTNIISTHKAIRQVLASAANKRQDSSRCSTPKEVLPDGVSVRSEEMFNKNEFSQFPMETNGSFTGIELNMKVGSSTEGLTVTSLAGVYIRSPDKGDESKDPKTEPNIQRESLVNEIIAVTDDPEPLDSSLMAVVIPSEGEEKINKVISTDEVMKGKLNESYHDTSQQYICDSESVTVLRSSSVGSPSSSAASSRARKSSMGVEEEAQPVLPRVSRRPVKTEPCLKMNSEDSGEEVPEFMRIQLNRVDSRTNAMILDDEPVMTNFKDSSEVKSKVVEGEVGKGKPNVGYQSPEPVKLRKKKKDMKLAEETGNLQDDALSSAKMKEVKLDSETKSDSDCDAMTAGAKTVSTELPKDEIVLRRPLVLDRSIVLDQAVQSSGQVPVSSDKSSKDQPELFKVFARRSFKLKDTDSEAPEAWKNKGESQRSSSPQPSIEGKSTPLSIPEKLTPDSSDVPLKTITTNPPAESQESPTTVVASTGPTPARGDTKKGINYLSKIVTNISRPSQPNFRDITNTAHFSSPMPFYKSSSPSPSSPSNIINHSSTGSSVNTPVTPVTPFMQSVKPIVWPPPSQRCEMTERPFANLPMLSISPKPILPQSKTDGNFADALACNETLLPTTKTPSFPMASAEDVATKQPLGGDASLRTRHILEQDQLAEAKNTSVTQSFDHKQRRASIPPSTSKETDKHTIVGSPDDWRALVKKRREGRMKQNKTLDSDEVIIENRPNASRNSKVLEMANNYQKLQVA